MNETKKKSLLIIDDEQIVIQALLEMLGSEYTIYVAKDGLEGIKQAKRLLPDVILLDIIMPYMDGYEVIAVLKESRDVKDIPIIFITGLDDMKAEEKALELGAADYIAKPFLPAIVKLRVQNQIKIIERLKIESDLNVVLRLQSELVAAKELAEHSNRAKSEFLSRMSHEMLTPMNAIMGMLRLIKARPDSADEYIEKANNASKQLLEMINDILDVSGTEYGIVKLDEAEFSFTEMVDNVINELTVYSNAKKQKLTYNIAQSIPEKLIGDERRLNQVINNLLTNAIKYTHESGEIHVEAHSINKNDENNTIQIEVTDNGLGISKDKQENLFDIFEQVDGSNTREHGGIGIGLALSKRIIGLMGGNIWVESDHGEGAKFIFTCVLRGVD